MKLILEQWRKFLTERAAWDGTPAIGWWLDNEVITFYHGTHINNLQGILKEGIFAPKSGYTAGKISLALEPNTAFGYASMSGAGGETAFRSKGTGAAHTPADERVVFIIKIPKQTITENMIAARGNMEDYRRKLIDKELYTNWRLEKGGDNYNEEKFDQQYYALTEIRLPEHISPNYITDFMKK